MPGGRHPALATSLAAAQSGPEGPAFGESGRGEQVHGWGRLPVPGCELRGEDLQGLGRRARLFRGLGRSYGDSSLPAPGQRIVASTVRADRILRFDPASGMLRAEAGLSLDEVVRLLLPRGFFPPVTPGTRFVTLGGMVASDVHGKNHHCDGTFGAHVRALKMSVADGRTVECSPDVHPDLFWATIGGMGLTGHILEVEFPMTRIPSPWVMMQSERVPDIDTYVARLDESADQWPMTMGWIDCLSRGRDCGRGILMCGRWATQQEAPDNAPRFKKSLTLPFVLPSFALNRMTMSLFNTLYYRKHWRKQWSGVVHPEPFFWPLDSIRHWNRLYGPRGFTQYQCVLPRRSSGSAARDFLEHLTARGGTPFLCVIKDCGPQGQGLLSFPMPGISIALDIPVRDNTQALIDALNEFVIAEGGRMYLTKDAFTRADHFAAMEPRLDAWRTVRDAWDPHHYFRSAQSVRMLGDDP